VRLHSPLRELRFAQVRRECLHNAAMRNCADKVHQGFLISPDGERPKLSRKRTGIEGIADKTWRASQLAHDFIREPEKFRNGVEMFERQTGNQCEIAGSEKRRFVGFPGCDWHAAILNRSVARIQKLRGQRGGQSGGNYFRCAKHSAHGQIERR
jgi:hypothetical protein